MNAFKRIVLFLFGLAGVIALVALLLPWVGFWQRGASALMAVSWYAITVYVTAGITMLGSLISLGRAIFTPRKAKSVTVSRENGDEVSVSTAAISAQAAHIIERDKEFYAEKVDVAVKHNKVIVVVRVRPAHAVDVTAEGKRLHDELTTGLERVCGNSIGRVKIHFVESDSLEAKPDYLTTGESASGLSYTGYGSPQDASYELPHDITVPMPAASPLDAGEGSES